MLSTAFLVVARVCKTSDFVSAEVEALPPNLRGNFGVRDHRVVKVVVRNNYFGRSGVYKIINIDYRPLKMKQRWQIYCE